MSYLLGCSNVMFFYILARQKQVDGEEELWGTPQEMEAKEKDALPIVTVKDLFNKYIYRQNED